MRLIYFWAHDKYKIESASIVFGSNRNFKYENGNLIVTPNPNHSTLLYKEYPRITTFHGIIGKNGAGKSSLLRLLADIIGGNEFNSDYLLLLEYGGEHLLITNNYSFDSSRIACAIEEFTINRIYHNSDDFFARKPISVIYYTSIIDYMTSIAGNKTFDLSTNSLLDDVKRERKSFEDFEIEWDEEVQDYLFSDVNDSEFLPVKSIRISFKNNYSQDVNETLATVFETLLTGQQPIITYYQTHIIKIIREYIQIVLSSSTEHIDNQFIAQYVDNFNNAFNNYLNNITDSQMVDTDLDIDTEIDNNIGSQIIALIQNLIEILDIYTDSNEEMDDDHKQEISELINSISDEAENYIMALNLEEAIINDGREVIHLSDPEELRGNHANVDNRSATQELLSRISHSQSEITNLIEFEDTEVVVDLIYEFIRLIPIESNSDEVGRTSFDVNAEEVSEVFDLGDRDGFKTLISELNEQLIHLTNNPEIIDNELGVIEINLLEKYDDVKRLYKILNDLKDLFTGTSFDKKMLQFELPTLSTGERYYYELMARIMKNSSRFHGENLVVLIDEGDVFLHPNAQRQYVEKLMTHLNRYDSNSLNLIVASNSPFIISDITRDRLTLLNSDGHELERTFGANIHEILAKDFFMEKTVGSYAYKRIINLSEEVAQIDDDNLISKYRVLLDCIGEEFVRRKLTEKFEKALPSKKDLIDSIMNIDDETILSNIRRVIIGT